MTESTANAIDAEKFLSVLLTLEKSLLGGDDQAVAKFQAAMARMMPQSFINGDYTYLGDLLRKLESYLPLTTSDYYCTKINQKRLRDCIRNVLESVTFLKENVTDTEKSIRMIEEIADAIEPVFNQLKKIEGSFIYINLKPGVKKLINVIDSQVEEIQLIIRPKIKKSKKFNDRMTLIEKNLYKDQSSILGTIFNFGQQQALSLDQHIERFSNEETLKKYKLIVTTALRMCIESQDYELSLIEEDIYNFINEGIISDDLWDRAEKFQKASGNVNARTGHLKPLFNHGPFEKDEPTEDERAVMMPILSVVDWLKMEIGRKLSFPFFKNCRRSLLLDRNILVQLHQEIQKSKSKINELCEQHEKGVIVKKYIEDMQNNLINKVNDSIYQKLKKVGPSLFPDQAKSFEHELDQLNSLLRLIPVMEAEAVDTIRAFREAIPKFSDGLKQIAKFDGSMNDMTEVFENLLSNCIKGVKYFSTSKTTYAPIYFAGNSPYNRAHIRKCINHTMKLFPALRIDNEEDALIDKDRFKAKDFFENFSLQDFAAKIKVVRSNLRASRSPEHQKSTVTFPGVGPGAFSNSSNVYIVPRFYNSSDFAPGNFYTAISDFITKTRSEALEGHSLEKLVEILKNQGDLDSMVSSSNYTLVFSAALQKLAQIRDTSSYYQLMLKELSPVLSKELKTWDGASLDNFFEEYLAKEQSGKNKAKHSNVSAKTEAEKGEPLSSGP